MVRLSRDERKEQTRRELVAAARTEFLARGFHQASVEEIAERAGYSKGAVYSNFEGKDELFLAVLDEQYARVLDAHGPRMRAAATMADGLRAAAAQLAEQARVDPGWTPLLIEFWAHAARVPVLREEARKRQEQQLDGVAAILSELAARHRVQFVVPAREAARCGTALGRGIAVERLLEPDSTVAELFEDAFVALVLGLTRPAGEQQ
jgi:AcrR family transcriptional regulator